MFSESPLEVESNTISGSKSTEIAMQMSTTTLHATWKRRNGTKAHQRYTTGEQQQELCPCPCTAISGARVMLICGELLRARSVQRSEKGKLRHLCPCNLRAASTAAAAPPPQPPRLAPWGKSLLVDNVADAWPCVTTGGCKCYSSVSCTVPPATLGSGDV